MDYPFISILLITYDRPKEIRQTIYALLKHLKYPRDRIHWHIADDKTPGTYLNDIRQEFKYLRFSATVTERKGWGANVNKGLVHCFEKTDFVFLCEDDYVALRQIDLERGVALLASQKDRHKPEQATKRQPVGNVRYDGIAAHWLNLELREADTPLGSVHYLHILKNSPFLNVYSNRPHLIHRRFHDKYGFYPEGLNLGETESGFAHKVKHSEKGPWICVLENGIEKSFDHIGKSRQRTELDKPQ